MNNSDEKVKESGTLFRTVDVTELKDGLLDSFDRYQEVTRCWRRIDGEWVIRDIAFTEQWSQTNKNEFISGLLGLKRRNGAVFAAEEQGRIIGIASLESEPSGSRGQYLMLYNLHVSAESRGRGIGRELFSMLCREAAVRGAEKLYISAHSSVESQAFYRAVGCVEAEEYNDVCVSMEPYDVQMEYDLKGLI